MSDKGFLLLAINTDEDRIKYAHATAMSIKLSDPTASVCVLVDKDAILESKYLKSDVFDYQVELPFGNTAYKDGFHGMNIWQLLHATPYDETIYIDYDTLFLNVDIAQLWEKFSTYDLAIPKFARSYRNTIASKHHLFEYETHYELPTLYNSLIYFKRASPLAIEWFKMADPVFQNWRDAYATLMQDKKPPTFNKNIICNIITYLLDIEKEIEVDLNNFYDLYIHAQGLWNKDLTDDWTEVLNCWFPENKKLIIENSIIPSGIIHYRNEEFLTTTIENEYRTQIDISNRRKATS